MNINKIAFIPHPTRGNEIINIFKSRGFRNPMNYDGIASDRYLNHVAYAGGCDGAEDCIIITNIDYLERVGYKIYTLEEWEELNKHENNIDPVMLSARDRGYIDEIIRALTNYGDEKMISYHEEIEFLKRIRKM